MRIVKSQVIFLGDASRRRPEKTEEVLSQSVVPKEAQVQTVRR